ADRVDPLVVAAAADVVEVVVDAVAAAALRQPAVRQLPHVAPVVVAEDDGDVVRRAQALVPVALDLLVEGLHLRDLGDVAAHLPLQDLPLRGDDALHQLDAVAVGQAGVAVAAHAEGDHALEALLLHAADALGPVLLDGLAVTAEAPLAVAAVRVALAGPGVPVPLLDAAHHRRLVRGADHDAVLLGDLVVARIVLGERPAPHRGPQVVRLEAEHQLEHLGVEVGVEAARVAGGLARAEVLGRPGAEVGVLVVDEEPAVLDLRGALGVPAGQHVEGVLVPGGHVVPPVPGGDADLLRHVVDAVDRAALVAAGDDERAGHAGHGVGHDLLEGGLPLALDALHI